MVCNKVVEVGYKIIEIMFKNAHLILKTSIYLICACQLIQLIFDYTKYDMTNEYRAEDHIEDISFTFCIDQDNLIELQTQLRVDNEDIDIRKALYITERYYSGKYCYSFTNNDNNTYNFIIEAKRYIIKYFYLYFKNYPIYTKLIAHLDKVPSHFGKIFSMNPKKQDVTLYNVQSEYSMRRLLPWPFEHDCYEYSSSSSKFKSREYCYLEEMRKLELKYCKVNNYWTLNTEYEKNITQCIIKPNFILLNKLCKINCLDISTDYTFAKNDMKISQDPTTNYSLLIAYNDIYKRRLYLEYLPKFTKMQLFSTLGGLLGMWLGLSINNLVFKLSEITGKIYLKLKIKILKLIITKIYPCLTFIIILSLIFNLIQLVMEFLSGHTITKFTITNEVYWPDIVINKYFKSYEEFELGFDDLVQNYSNIKQKVYENYPHLGTLDVKDPEFIRDFKGVFLKEIMLEYGYEYFCKHIFPELDGLSCTIIDINENYFDCKNIFKKAIQMNELGFYLNYEFNKKLLYQNINVTNMIKKIIIVHNVEKYFTKTLLIRENNIVKYFFYFNNGTEISIKFQKILLINSLSSLKKKCISMEQNKFYDINDCRIKYINNFVINNLSWNCMPRDMRLFYVDDLKLLGDKFCHPNITFEPYLANLLAQSCPLPCDSEFVTADIDQKPHHDTIKINLIPKFNSKPIFTQTLSMDYNNFIYDLGGTIGMWIGWSALTIPIHIYEKSKKLNFQIICYYFLKIWKIIFIILHYALFKSILFFKYLLNLFQSLINIIKNINLFSCILQNRVNP